MLLTDVFLTGAAFLADFFATAFFAGAAFFATFLTGAAFFAAFFKTFLTAFLTADFLADFFAVAVAEAVEAAGDLLTCNPVCRFYMDSVHFFLPAREVIAPSTPFTREP